MARPKNMPMEHQAIYEATAAITPRLEFRLRGAADTTPEHYDRNTVSVAGELVQMGEVQRIFAQVYANARAKRIAAE